MALEGLKEKIKNKQKRVFKLKNKYKGMDNSAFAKALEDTKKYLETGIEPLERR